MGGAKRRADPGMHQVNRRGTSKKQRGKADEHARTYTCLSDSLVVLAEWRSPDRGSRLDRNKMGSAPYLWCPVQHEKATKLKAVKKNSFAM